MGHLSSGRTARTIPGAYEEFLELSRCVQRKGTLGKEEAHIPTCTLSHVVTSTGVILAPPPPLRNTRAHNPVCTHAMPTQSGHNPLPQSSQLPGSSPQHRWFPHPGLLCLLIRTVLPIGVGMEESPPPPPAVRKHTGQGPRVLARGSSSRTFNRMSPWPSA